MITKKIIIVTVIISINGFMYNCSFSEQKLNTDSKVDKIVVYKSKRQLLVFSQGEILKKYRISLGRNPVGAKEFQGDRKTPEGLYYINGKNPYSGYHKNLGISYPNKQDIENARKIGKPAGGDIKIHGFRNGLGFFEILFKRSDWTYGCIALTNSEVDELYKFVEIGTIIEIKP